MDSKELGKMLPMDGCETTAAHALIAIVEMMEMQNKMLDRIGDKLNLINDNLKALGRVR